MPTSDALATRAATAFAAYRLGDRSQMSELVDLLTPLLWRTARAQRAAPSDAEEAVQNAWLKLVTYADRIEDNQAVLGWLLVTVKREAWRLVARSDHEVAGLTDTLDVESNVPGPDVLSMLGERQQILWEHVSELSDQCRHLLGVIAFATRPDYAGVAEHLGMPIGSIGPTRGRCLNKLRKSLTTDPRWSDVR